MSSIADRLLSLRGKTKQKEFASTLGINANTLRNYENGRVLPNHDVLSNVCVQFSVNPEWLLLGKGPMYREADDLQGDHKEHLAETQAIPAVTSPSDAEDLRRENRELRQDLRKEREKNEELVTRLLRLTEENGDLRVQLARAAPDPAIANRKSA